MLTRFSPIALLILSGLVLVAGAQPQISEDRELKEFDLSQWNCVNRLEGSARTPDGVERDRLKNRSAINVAGAYVARFDIPGFLKFVNSFDSLPQGMRRKDIAPDLHEKLSSLEKQLVQLTGYLVLAYCGPPETANCASMEFHDWHLELFEKQADHPPQPGDPTPVICEVTPRTQNAIYKDGIRIQELTAFFRRPAPDLTCEATGHPAIKIRVTGYLLWDDAHDGSVEVGPTIRKIGVNGYHRPWRSTAWEIHPVVKIERADVTGAGEVATQEPSPPRENSTSAERNYSTPAASIRSESHGLAASAQPTTLKTPKFVILTQPVKIKIPYGETLLPRGTKLPVVSRDAQTVKVHYLNETYAIPITSTDLR
jgi:hypothetical protein